MPAQDWAEPLKSVIVPLTPDRELHLEWMPDVLRHLGVEHQMVEWWNPLTSNWYCFETSFGVRVEEGEKHILFRRPAVAIKDFWEKARLCTEAGDDILEDPRARDFTQQYRHVVTRDEP